jgi:hypothetical protein
MITINEGREKARGDGTYSPRPVEFAQILDDSTLDRKERSVRANRH